VDEDELVALEALRSGASYRDAPPDDQPLTDLERAEIEAAKRNGHYITTEELRARLAKRT
jgi:hypothetical protein